MRSTACRSRSNTFISEHQRAVSACARPAVPKGPVFDRGELGALALKMTKK